MNTRDNSFIISDDELINNFEQKQPVKGYMLHKTKDGISIKVNTQLLNRVEPTAVEY